MNLLLDSQALWWLMSAPGKLRAEASEAITDSHRAVFFSAASIWEMELKAAAGKIELPDDWVEGAVRRGYRELPIRSAEARASARLPRHHRDPFDRLIVAQAQLHGLRIATRDLRLSAYGVPILRV